MNLPIVSIVVPAHNEAAGIAGTLDRLTAGAAAGEFDVVVVANACTDRTAQLAKETGVRVIETPVPGKAHALGLGDAACTAFPRIYLDADVVLTTDSVRALVAAAARPGVLACAPVPVWDLEGASWAARRVHRVHDRLVGPSRALAGVGVYTLTEAGHARVFPLPEGLLADDGWVQASFTEDERAVVPEAASVVRPARTIGAHLNRRVRVRLGNRQLAELGRPVNAVPLRLGDLRRLVTSRAVSPLDAACYLFVQVADRVLTRFRRDRPVSWGTDASSR